MVQRRHADLDHRVPRLADDQRRWTSISPAPTCCIAATEYDDSSTAFETFSQEFRLTGSTDAGLDGRHVLLRRGPRAPRPVRDRRRLRALPVDAGRQPGARRAGGAAGAARRDRRYQPIRRRSCRRSAGVRSAPTSSATVRRTATTRTRRALALFTNNTFHATDKLDLTLGLRYTHDKKELNSVYSNPNGSLGCGATAGQSGRAGRCRAGRAHPGLGVPAAGAAGGAGRRGRAQHRRLHVPAVGQRAAQRPRHRPGARPRRNGRAR